MTVWKQLKYLKKGISHVQNGMSCQDSVLIYENENCIVASLADGLGSLKYSEVAAQTATESVCKYFSEQNNLLEQFDTKKDLAKHILDTVVMNIQDRAIELSVPLNEMDCTLIFVCVLKTTNYAIIGRLGDSAVCVIADPKSIAINDGNRSANGTNAILDKDAVDHFDIQIINLNKNNVYAFVLSSDGLENELYMKGSDHVNKTAELYFNAFFISDNPVSIIAERISKLTKIEGTPFDDDISVAVISRADKKINLPPDPKWLCTCGFRNNLQTTYCQHCHKDFSILYQNIRFKDYGGKAAFFTEINKNPEEELRIIGKKSKASLVNAFSDVAVTPLSVSPYNNTYNVSQSKKINSVEVKYPVGKKASTSKTSGFEADTDLHKELQRKVSPVAESEELSWGSDMQNELADKKQSVIHVKHTNRKKKCMPILDNFGKKKVKNIPLQDGKVEVPKKQNRGKYASTKRKPQYYHKKLKIFGILMSIVLVIGLVAGGLFVKKITADKVNTLIENVDELSKKVKQYEAELAEKEMQSVVLLPEDFSVLEDGSYYWGTVDDSKLPHGFGILEKDDKYYIGNFKHGKKDGEFSIVDSAKVHRVANYEEDKLISVKEEDD